MNPAANERRTRNLRTLASYFRLLEEKDLDSWRTLWTDDCTQLIPYASGDLPKALHGADEVYLLYRRIAAGYTKLRFTLTEFHPMYDPDQVFARWHPRCELVGGGVYTNESIGLFEFDTNGKIARFTEYFNPLGFVQNFETF